MCSTAGHAAFSAAEDRNARRERVHVLVAVCSVMARASMQKWTIKTADLVATRAAGIEPVSKEIALVSMV